MICLKMLRYSPPADCVVALSKVSQAPVRQLLSIVDLQMAIYLGIHVLWQHLVSGDFIPTALWICGWHSIKVSTPCVVATFWIGICVWQSIKKSMCFGHIFWILFFYSDVDPGIHLNATSVNIAI